VLRTPAQALRELWRLVDALKPELPSVRQPTLLIQARDDDVASIANAQYLQRRLGGLVDTLILDDSYHLITVDRQRNIVTDRIVSFVGSIAKTVKSTEPAKAAVSVHAA
jgi:carboxylesterase